MFGSATLAMVVSSACISVASITDTTSKPRLATSRWVATALIERLLQRFGHACGFAVVAALQTADDRILLAGVDLHDRTHAGAQDGTCVLIVDRHAHRNALHDL